MSDILDRISRRKAELAGRKTAGVEDRIAARRAQLQEQVVATTSDGGRVLKMDDGSLSFTSPGYATTDQDRIAEIMKGATPAEMVQGDLDRERIAKNPIAARGQEFVQGTPLVGEWMDEAVGLVSPDAAQNMRATSDAMERQHPGQSIALNIAGGVASAIPAAAAVGGTAAANFVGRGANVLTRGLRAGAIAAPAGAIEGAASFAGRADDGERVTNAGKGAVVGGGLAAVLGPLASMTGEGVVSMAKKIKKLDVRTIADEFGISMPAARSVRAALINDDLAAAQARLGQLGDDALLADAGPGTGALLDAAAATGGNALKAAREAADGRAGEFGKRLPGVLDGLLGKPQGVKTAAKAIAQETSPARKAAYDAAYSKPINYAEGAGRSIEGVLSRVPPKTLNEAVSEANEAMIEAGIRNKQIMAKIADDGSVAFQEMPNVQQLDFLKRALDDVSRKNVDQFGRPNAAGVRAGRLAADLREAVKQAVPEYARALRMGGDKIQRDEGLLLGRRLLFKSTTLEDVRGFLNQGVSNEARQAIRQGMREAIEENLSNVRRTITDANTDAREAMQLVKEISSRANVAKVRAVLGQSRADRLLNELDRTAVALELRAAVATNSKTAQRQAIQGQVKDEATPGLLRRTAGNMGNPLDAAQEISRSVSGIDPRSMSATEKAIFDEIAQALVSIKGDDAQRALAVVRRAMSGQPIKDVEAQLIGKVVAGSGGLALYQSGKQFLATR